MTESSGTDGAPQERPPHGSQEATASEVGEPGRESGDERQAREEQRPDLDERQRRISTQRKPMGPPLEDLDVEPGDTAQETAPEVPPEEPTDPSEP